jgi:adenosylcobinamide-phosphate synthase
MSAPILVSLLVALVIDRIVGDPDMLWRRFPHPVVIFGKAIAALDRLLNRPALPARLRKRNGVIAIVLLLAASLVAGAALHAAFGLLGPFGVLLEAVFAAIFLAQKSLSDHVRAVAVGLRQQGLAGGRLAVSMIVGRDPSTLDAPAVCRAAIESLAENFSDGVVAPACWYAVLGLPGLLAYKMLNTADSMIGHKSEKYFDFGWASARLDDLANWLPARLSLLLIAGGAFWASGRSAGRNALRVGLRDHGLHRSPNSGWPEAAMAGALDIRLAGPRIYAGEIVREPMLNGAGRATADVADVETAIAVFHGSCVALFILVFVCLCFAIV